mgnify:FL=1
MKCRKCGGKAVLNMRQHKLALCGEHYLEWLPEQVERFVEKYKMFTRQEKVLVAVSGGKDSLGLWDILHGLGYRTEGLYIGLGINDEGLPYSDESRRLSEQFAAERGLTLHVVDVAARFGATIPELSVISNRGHGKPCSVCGLNKRYIMNRAALEGGFDALVTGHNLDDEVAVLMQNTFNWAGGYLARQAPVLAASGGLTRKVKPLCRIYEREMTAYCLVRGIEYIYEECPHVGGSTTLYYKEVLNKMEEDRPGAKLQFYLSFLQAKEQGLFAAAEDKADLHPCERCGQPTSAPGECSFCRLWDKVALVKQTVAAPASQPLLTAA